MYYLLPIPIILVAAIVKLVSNRYKLKLFSAISLVVIILGVMLFIYLYSAYLGYDMLEYARALLGF